MPVNYEFKDTKIDTGDNYVQEVFGLLPFNVTKIDSLGGTDLFSSPELKRKVVDVFYAQKVLIPVIDSIEKLVEREIINPCFASANLIKLIAHKLFSDSMSKAIRGFYVSEKNKVFLLLDNNTTFMAWVSDSAITYLTLHELQHYAAFNMNTNEYLKLNDAVLTKYYRKFFETYFGIELNNEFAQSYYYYIFKEIEKKHDLSRDTFTKLAKHLEKKLKDFSDNDDQITVKVENLFTVLRTYTTNPNVFIGDVYRQGNTRDLVLTLINSYKALGIRRPNTMAIQELLYPSEVLAIQSQHKPSKNNFDVINSIAG